VRLVTLDRTLDLPSSAADALGPVIAGRVFTPGGLPGLAPEDGLALARHLVREGVVVPA
jgi:hypothetical protein